MLLLLTSSQSTSRVMMPPLQITRWALFKGLLRALKGLNKDLKGFEKGVQLWLYVFYRFLWFERFSLNGKCHHEKKRFLRFITIVCAKCFNQIYAWRRGRHRCKIRKLFWGKPARHNKKNSHALLYFQCCCLSIAWFFIWGPLLLQNSLNVKLKPCFNPVKAFWNYLCKFCKASWQLLKALKSYWKPLRRRRLFVEP